MKWFSEVFFDSASLQMNDKLCYFLNKYGLKPENIRIVGPNTVNGHTVSITLYYLSNTKFE